MCPNGHGVQKGPVLHVYGWFVPHFHVPGLQLDLTGANLIWFSLAAGAEVEIIQWFVKVGDNIKAFDRVCEVQSDKATVEISSRYDGEVVKVYADAGGIANVGEPLIDIRKPNTAPADVSNATDQSTPMVSGCAFLPFCSNPSRFGSLRGHKMKSRCAHEQL